LVQKYQHKSCSLHVDGIDYSDAQLRSYGELKMSLKYLQAKLVSFWNDSNSDSKKKTSQMLINLGFAGQAFGGHIWSMGRMLCMPGLNKWWQITDHTDKVLESGKFLFLKWSCRYQNQMTH